jgi:uncharacterized protein (UPF0261 family)
MATIAVLGTLDTKAEEHAFVAEIITQRGHIPLLIDVGSLNPPGVAPDIPREEIAEAAGVKTTELDDRGQAVKAMGKGAADVLIKLIKEGRIDGIISLGGGGGTSIGTTAMRALPIGFPKLMVSTLAASESAPIYMGVKDVTMMPSIVDVAGLNRISRKIFTNAAGEICGMVESTPAASTNEKPIIVASMFGNTTECLNHAKAILEAEGYEVLVFHATGTGGRTMESLIETGMVSGVLDITTTEMADELAGGILSAGPNRLMAAALNGIPTIIAPGCLDMVNFGAMESIPKKYQGRTFYKHNPQVTLMRTTPSESAELGRRLAEKANLSTGPVTLLFPRKAISIISAKGQPFHDTKADAALLESIRDNLREGIRLIEMDRAINDPEFAEACAQQLLESLKQAI